MDDGMNSAVMKFLLERRSVSHKTLIAPPPDGEALGLILEAGARVPDHKMLEPFRFVVLERGALDRMADVVEARGRDLGLDEDKVAKARFSFANAPLSVAVVASLVDTDMIPEVEQTLAVGACCLSVLNAALAAGWGANWITGWAAFDPVVLAEMSVQDGEYVAGFMHMGTIKTQPSERKRPDLEAKVTWLSS